MPQQSAAFDINVNFLMKSPIVNYRDKWRWPNKLTMLSTTEKLIPLQLGKFVVFVGLCVDN